jgi:hypothetical protein
MGEVKRYEFIGGEIRERAPGWSGGMVYDHDYLALERERDDLLAKSAECQCDRLGPETVECAQIVGEALAGPASLHIGHLPDMCRDLVAELTRLRAVEKAANAFLDAYESQPSPAVVYARLELAEACGRKG